MWPGTSEWHNGFRVAAAYIVRDSTYRRLSACARLSFARMHLLISNLFTLPRSVLLQCILAIRYYSSSHLTHFTIAPPPSRPLANHFLSLRSFERRNTLLNSVSFPPPPPSTPPTFCNSASNIISWNESNNFWIDLVRKLMNEYYIATACVTLFLYTTYNICHHTQFY